MIDYENLLYECEVIYESLVQRNLTIRMASTELGIARSTIHYRIHKIIKKADPQSYYEIINKLEYNKFFRAKPRKYWKGFLSNENFN